MEAAVFRRASPVEGDRLSLGAFAVAALENQPKGVDFCLGLAGACTMGGGCGEGARASDFRLAAGPPHGTDGNDAEKLPNREGRACGFGGGAGADSSLVSKLAVIDFTDCFLESVWDVVEAVLSATGIGSVAEDTGFESVLSATFCSTDPLAPCSAKEVLLFRWEGCSDSGAGRLESVGELTFESSCESLASSKFCA
jgi:hypothetical protein